MAVAGCASEGANDAAQAGDGTEYTEAAAMSIHLAEPERALSIIDPAEFVDFARGQTLVFLTIAYATQGDTAKGLEAEEAVFRTQWSQSPDCDLMLVSAYHRLGQFDRFDQAMDRIDAEMIARGDTLNANYHTGLQLRSSAAEMRGRYADALHYANRASVVRDSLEYYNQREQLNELATVYHL